MALPPPTNMDADAAAKVLASTWGDARGPVTVADAAARSGLPLRDAERGLHALTRTYRGHLRVTESGDLTFLFPHGFTRPWQRRDALSRAGEVVLRGSVAAGRFILRAWLMIAIVAYAATFLGLLLALALARRGGSRDDIAGSLARVILRVLADALFWTFHPFSPVGLHGYGDTHPEPPKDETPFYEKVNRFVFGPTPEPEDPHAMQRLILAEVRAQKGRIGLADVMRVTGLPREEADPLMARLMLDYDGDVGVSEDGGITYRFEALRKTTAAPGAGRSEPTEPRPPPAWASPRTVPPLTGNTGGANLLVAALNGFNLLMAAYALSANMTLARVAWLLDPPDVVATPMGPDGLPIVLGVIPLVFSAAIFLLPLGRALLAPSRARAVARENARLAVLREVLGGIERKAPVTDGGLRNAWVKATGMEPGGTDLTRTVVDLGGDAEVVEETGEVRYRFVDLETEARALDAEREVAPDEEARIGRVVFSSDR